jgi:iron complex transport system permease protein
MSRPVAVFVVALATLAAGSLVHLSQGTAHVSVEELIRSVLPWTDNDVGRSQIVDILVASRMPRLAAALLVGIALGFAGGILQSIARNPLASPDTLAVNAGAYVAVVATAAFGIAVPFYLGGFVAMIGGLLAAGLVLLVAQGGATGPTRLILAGSAVALALSSVTTVMLMLFQQNTLGLYQWGSGTTVQSGSHQVTLAAPLVGIGVLAAMLLTHRLDVLGLGDDTAKVLGLNVVRTRVVGVIVAVFLAAAAVTVAGPIGFVGLCAPVVARLIASRVPELAKSALLLPLAGLVGALIVVLADVLLRIIVDTEYAIAVPTGVVTTFAGAIVMVVMARRLRDSTSGALSSGSRGRVRSTPWVVAVFVTLAVCLAAAAVLALLFGDTHITFGELVEWWRGVATDQAGFVLSTRSPRVMAAIFGGAALALAGILVQAICRNPLAEPSLLGGTPGASVAAIAITLIFPGVSVWPMMAAATVAAVATFGLVYWLAAGSGVRGKGLSSDRIVLVGVGVGAAAAALTTLLVVIFSPWSVNTALTWLSGSTYGRTIGQVLPAIVCLAVAVPVTFLGARSLDLVSLDEDVPRVLGVPLRSARFGFLMLAAVLTAAAACAVGALAFVGLVAPHAARALVGATHRRAMPVAILLGALLVSVADTVGRTVIAPAQIAAGLVTALIGAPYFVLLLWRSRTRG